jgi:hypothetical protein
MLIGRLHCLTPTWQQASVDFLKSGGFIASSLVSRVQQRTLVLWGADDKILEPSTAARFEQTLPRSEVYFIDKCGHVPHLVCTHNSKPFFITYSYELYLIITILLFIHYSMRNLLNVKLQEKPDETAERILRFLGDKK